MEKPILYCDCDGVLFDTIDTAFQIMREHGVDMNDHAAIDYFFKRELDWHDVFKRAEIINDGISKLKILDQSGLFKEVVILTRLSGSYYEEGIKRDLFNIMLPNNQVITLEFGLSKASIVPFENNILVDDEMKNITPWMKKGCAILFKKNGYDLENDIVSDLLDVPNTNGVKKLLKIR